MGYPNQVTHNSVCDESVFIETCLRLKNGEKVAKALGMNKRSVQRRRNKIEKRTGLRLDLNSNQSEKLRVQIPQRSPRIDVELDTGVIMVGSDAHYQPGEVTTAQRAFLYLVDKLKPEIIVMNGDSFDGAAAGKYPPIMWEERPTIQEELEAVQDNLDNIAQACKNAKLFHTWGNHDMRFNSRLAASVDMFRGVDGFDFTDHIPGWTFSMSLMVNDNTMIKHRWHNGVHATWNNIIKSGRNFVTGHLHSLQVRPFTDYNGTRYAVDTGTLAYPDGNQFAYAEDNPKNHRSGFAVLTFIDGELMPPEMCEVISEGVCFFRGHQFNV